MSSWPEGVSETAAGAEGCLDMADLMAAVMVGCVGVMQGPVANEANLERCDGGRWERCGFVGDTVIDMLELAVDTKTR